MNEIPLFAPEAPVVVWPDDMASFEEGRPLSREEDSILRGEISATSGNVPRLGSGTFSPCEIAWVLLCKREAGPNFVWKNFAVPIQYGNIRRRFSNGSRYEEFKGESRPEHTNTSRTFLRFEIYNSVDRIKNIVKAIQRNEKGTQPGLDRKVAAARRLLENDRIDVLFERIRLFVCGGRLYNDPRYEIEDMSYVE